MYLSRLDLNPRSRDVQRDVLDCQAMHRRVMSGFPDLPAVDQNAREKLGVLFRVELEHRANALTLLVQSRVEPDWSRLPAGYLRSGVASNPRCKAIDAVLTYLKPDLRCRFRLRANPTKRIHERNTAQEEKWRGKRVDLFDDADRRKWLMRRSEEAGFVIEALEPESRGEVEVIGDERVHGRRGRGEDGKRLTFGGVTFEGRLRVVDPVRFREALEKGIGPGKAYGFGLLSIAPAR